MIKEQGLVVELNGSMAMVQTVSKASCNSCKVNSSCGTGIISKAFGERSFITPMTNNIKAEIGDQVEVGIPEDLIVKTSLLVYLFPIIFMLVMLFSLKFTSANLGYLLSEPFLILAAIISLALGFYLVRRLGEKMNKNKPLEPVLLRTVKRVIDVKQIDTP